MEVSAVLVVVTGQYQIRAPVTLTVQRKTGSEMLYEGVGVIYNHSLYMPRSKANGFSLQKRHVRMTLVSRY